MSYSIAKDFRFFSLLRFALPTMIMMVFMSLYTIVDGILISRLANPRTFRNQYCISSAEPRDRHRRHARNRRKCDHREKDGEGKTQEAREDSLSDSLSESSSDSL